MEPGAAVSRTFRAPVATFSTVSEPAPNETVKSSNKGTPPTAKYVPHISVFEEHVLRMVHLSHGHTLCHAWRTRQRGARQI